MVTNFHVIIRNISSLGLYAFLSHYSASKKLRRRMYQTTIEFPVSCYGIGVHSGQTVQLTLKPAKADTGVVFIRTDISYGNNHIVADFLNVSETSMCTKISSENNASVSTIEHLMAAIWGSSIDNLIVEIDGPEVPIMDGSSQPFVFMLECAQTKALNSKRKYLKLQTEIIVDNNKGSEVIASPSDKFKIMMDIDFKSKAIGKQSMAYESKELFNTEIASARTFGFIQELEYLQSHGLAKGASLNNAIGIDNDLILNHDGLRYKDEFVRHKMLDAIGDFRLAASNIIANIHCVKTGHALNNELLRKIFENTANYSFLSQDEILAL